MNPLIRAIPIIALPIAIFAIYRQTLNYPFQFDDFLGIVGNQAIMDLSDIGRIWSYNPSRFIHFLSLAFNYHLGEYDVFGWHLFNIILHSVTSIVYFLFAGLLLRASARLAGVAVSEPLLLACQFSAALIFAVHPLQTQAVTFVWQRSASMATLFYVGSMALYLKSAQEEAEGKSAGEWRPWLIAAWAAAFLSMFTKQFTVTLPVALVLLDFMAVSGSYAGLKKRMARLAPFAPLILIIPALTTLVGKGEVGDLGMRAANLLSPYRYLLTEFNVIVHYLSLLIYPVNQNLDYDFPPSSGFGDSAVSFFILVSIDVAGILLRRINPAAGFGILFFFLAMSVESSFYPLEDPVFEHRMYMPMTGLLAALASLAMAALTRLAPGRPGAAIALALLLAMALPLSLASMKRNLVWSDPVLLWEDVVAKSPKKARGYNNLAVSLFKVGDVERGLALLRKAEEVDPKFNMTYLNLGLILEHKGQYSEALPYFLQAVRRDPTLPDATYRTGALLFRMNRFEDAAKYFLMAIKINPGHKSAWMELGVSLGLAGNLDAAKKVFADIIKRDPSNGQAHYNLAMALLQKGDKPKARELFARAKSLGYTEAAPAL